jgi:hypothetical protein
MRRRTLPVLSLSAAIDKYVKARHVYPVSTSDAVRTLRFLFPRCEHDDDELAQLVADSAIRNGRNVAFDREKLTAH